MSESRPLLTPDSRYVVVRGRLWRAANPSLSDNDRDTLVKDLMNARRAIRAARAAGDRATEDAAHKAVGRAKVALGERGPAWWTDGAPDFNRHMAHNTPYADWYRSEQSKKT